MTSNTEKRSKLPKNRLYAMLAVVINLALVFGVYALQFNVPDDEDRLIQAARDYVEFDIDVKDIVHQGNGMLLTFVATG